MHGEGMYVCGVRWCVWQRRVCMIVAVCVVKVRECVGCGDGRVRGEEVAELLLFCIEGHVHN